MAQEIADYLKLPEDVKATRYDGSKESLDFIVDWVLGEGGLAFPAEDLMWRHDMGTYWHPQHGFIYLPQGARRAGSPITSLRDDELVVRTNLSTFALVFPGDFVVRSRSGFYPRSAESFHRSCVSAGRRRGTNTTPALSPAV